MTWRGLLLDNLAFKLVALVVVSLLWLSVTADERQAQGVRTRLEVEVRDSSWVLVEAPPEVNTVFQGRMRDLLGLLMEEPTIRLTIDTVTAAEMRLPLRLEDVIYDRDRPVIPSLVQPGAVRLRFERRASVRVPVVADVHVLPAGGYSALLPPLIDPDSVTLRGPASRVQDMVRVTTRALELEGIENTVVRDVPIELPADGALTVEPQSVLVTIEIDSLIARNRSIPLRIVGSASAGVVAEPPRVSLEVRGASTSVAALLDSITEIPVRVDRPITEATRFDLQLESLPEGTAAVSLEPSAVTLRPAP